MSLSLKPGRKYYAFLICLFIITKVISVYKGRFQNGLDPSWMFSLNHAVTHHLTFGKDIIFTYGPLAYLGYTTTVGLAIIPVLLSVIIKVIYLAYFLCILLDLAAYCTDSELSSDVDKLIKYLLLPWLIYTAGIYGEYTLIYLFCLIHACVYGISAQPNSLFKKAHLPEAFFTAFAGFTVAILFFIKVSFLPFAIAVPAVLTISLFRKNGKQFLSFLLTSLITFGVVYCCVNIQLKDYLVNSLQIISGYKQAMQIATYDNYSRDYTISLGLIALFLIQYLFIKPSQYLPKLLLILLLCLGIYFIFVYSFTRGAKGVEGGLILNAPFIVILFFFLALLVTEAKFLLRARHIIALVLVGSIFCYAYYNAKTLLSKDNTHYVSTLPASALNSSETYNVYPFLTSIAYINHLNYKPQPVVQSYSAYTVKLDSLDAIFFAGQKVDNIIFHGGTTNTDPYANAIDGRYFMYDEPLTKLAILKNYQVSHQINDSTFIATKHKAIEIRSDSLLEDKVLPLNTTYQIPADSGHILFFTADFKYTNKAKLLSLIKKFPYIKMDIVLDSGKPLTFNLVSGLLTKPCVLNKYCENYTDFFKLASINTSGTLHSVKSVKFYASSAGYEPDFKFRVFRYSVK